jgi:hypothetical protein
MSASLPQPIAFVQRERGGYPNETDPDTGEIVSRRLTLELCNAPQAQINKFLALFEAAFKTFLDAGAVIADDDLSPDDETVICESCSRVLGTGFEVEEVS